MSTLRQGAKNASPSSDKNVRMTVGGHYVGKGAFVQNVFSTPTRFFELLAECLQKTEITSDDMWVVTDGRMDDAIAKLREEIRARTKKGGKVIFIGNGGSAAIASHMAVDWTKNGGVRSIALNDAPTLTCVANDFGYENVFAKQLEWYVAPRDVVIIVSSSGKSENIIRAAQYCFEDRVQCRVVTLSGMNPANYLRRLGHVNFYVPVVDYGLVELSHLCILHSIVSVQP